MRQSAFARMSLAAVMIVSIGAPQAAHAWLKGKAGPSGATIYRQANASSQVVGTVGAGRGLALSDRPSNGFYRVNAGKGLTGWVSENDVDLGGGSQDSSSASTSSSSGGRTMKKETYLGPLIGMGFYEGGSKLNFGLTGGMKLGPAWGLGLYFTYASLGSESVGGVTSSGKLIIIAPELNYFFAELPGFHAGAKIGLAMASASTSGGAALGIPDQSTSSAGLAFGAGAAYDAPVSDDWTVGGEANFLVYSQSGSSSTTSGSTTTTSSSTTAIHILLSAKYWF